MLKTVELRETFRQRTLNYFEAFRKKRSFFIADAISGVCKKTKSVLSQLLGESSSVLPNLFGSHLESADKFNCFGIKKVNQIVKDFLNRALTLQ